MDQERLLQLLGQFLPAHSPGGQEEEMDRLLLPLFERYCEDVRFDAADNLIGKIPGRSSDGAVALVAHKDELGMIVKRIEEDGRIRVEPLGGAYPWKYGEGPVDILAPGGVVRSILSVGSVHTSPETELVEKAREKALDWPMVRLLTRMSKAEVVEQGICAGTRAVIARERKGPFAFADCVSGVGLDDKAAVAVMIGTMEAIRAGGPPPRDLYFVASSGEEYLGGSASYAVARLPVEEMIALEIGPVEVEYGLTADTRPVLWYKDRLQPYHKGLSDRLAGVAHDLGIGVQRAIYSRGATDASHARSQGHVGRIACLSFPAENSHGFEVAPIEGILNMERVLTAYVQSSPAR